MKTENTTITNQQHGQTRSVERQQSASARAQVFLSYLCTRYLLSFNRPKESDPDAGKWIYIQQNRDTPGLRWIDGDLIPYDGNTSGKWRDLIDELMRDGVIHQRVEKTPSNGRKRRLYAPLIDPVKYFNPDVLKSEIKPLGDLHTYMANCLPHFTLSDDAKNAYLLHLHHTNFERFLKYKNVFQFIDKAPRVFFKVDSFADRVHTPFSSMETVVRPHILCKGQPTTSIDVKTSQPLILGEILEKNVPGNEFTKWVRDGLDVYEVMRERANLSTRAQGKDLFFQLIFAPPKKQLEKLFPGADWVQWLNNEKNKPWKHPKGAKYSQKRYNVIAYKLQKTESVLMGRVWHKIKDENVPFLSVHDEIIIPEIYGHRAKQIMLDVLHEVIPHAKIEMSKGNKYAPDDYLKTQYMRYRKYTPYLTRNKTFVIDPSEGIEIAAKKWHKSELILIKARQQYIDQEIINTDERGTY